jgi:UDP-N-acetylglucosamine 2-epimerase (non-hydrolysing)
VDVREKFTTIISGVSEIAKEAPILFPCHPRTRKQIETFNLQSAFKTLDISNTMGPGIYLTNPLGYNDFLYIWKDAAAVLTDSGGLQEETTALKIPCITIRENTERPVTVSVGSNVVVGTDKKKIVDYGFKALKRDWKKSQIPALWDGRASERIVSILLKVLN